MLHHPVRCTDLSDFFTLDDGTPIVDWSWFNEHCHAPHGNLKVRTIRWSPLNESDEESDTGSLDYQNINTDVQHEELLDMRRPYQDESQVETINNPGQRLQDKLYDWLATKQYPVDVRQFYEYRVETRTSDKERDCYGYWHIFLAASLVKRSTHTKGFRLRMAFVY